jgi:cytochrome c553
MKFTLLLATLITAAAAAPAPEAAAAPAEAGDVSTLATKKWTASGGCKTDWAGRCNAQCIGEAKQKGYKCKEVDSDITGSNCFVGWSTCKCTCFS